MHSQSDTRRYIGYEDLKDNEDDKKESVDDYLNEYSNTKLLDMLREEEHNSNPFRSYATDKALQSLSLVSVSVDMEETLQM